MTQAITLTPEQDKAVKAIVSWYGDIMRPEFYLAGYAGTGKSTLVERAVQDIMTKHRISRVRIGAYTGKAAHVLRSKGNENAATIHSMTYKCVTDEKTGRPRFTLDRKGLAATAELLILDESSMIPEDMARDLRSFGVKILVIGDPGQLPPVKGTGAFINRKPDAVLTQIHRQAAESPILRLATMAREGKWINTGVLSPDVRVIPSEADAAHYVYDPTTQVICGLNRVRMDLTQKIRSRMNFTGILPMAGERVICCANNRAYGVFNGMLGDLETITRSTQYGCPFLDMSIAMEDGNVPLVPVHPYLFLAHQEPKKKVERIRLDPDICVYDWGHVLTTHKAQGSQWPRVTVIDDSQAFREDSAKWLYTAITRAEKELTLIVRR